MNRYFVLPRKRQFTVSLVRLQRCGNDFHPAVSLSQTKPRVAHPSAFFALCGKRCRQRDLWQHQNNSVIPPVAKQLCHPDRSEAEWRDLVFCLIARTNVCPTYDVWGRPGFSRADTIPLNPGLQPLRDLPTRRGRPARQKSNRSGRRVAQCFSSPKPNRGCPILARSLR
jgi:hypothetical protein